MEPVYPTMVGGKCQIYGVYITGQKIKSTYIRKTFPLVFIFTPQTEKLSRCHDTLSMQKVSIKDLPKLLGTLSSAVLAILSAPCK